MSTLTRNRVSAKIAVGTTVELFILDCASCGVVFAITRDYEQRRRRDGRALHCPNGHANSWHETEEDRQRKRADQAEQQAEYARISARAWRDQATAAERSARAYRGHITRLRRKIASGVCPVPGCRRNFANVKAHIEGQHPDWAHEHPEALT